MSQLINLYSDFAINQQLAYSHSFTQINPGDYIPKDYLTESLFLSTASNYFSQPRLRSTPKRQQRLEKSLKKRSLAKNYAPKFEKSSNFDSSTSTATVSASKPASINEIITKSNQVVPFYPQRQIELESTTGQKIAVNRKNQLYPKTKYQQHFENLLTSNTKLQKLKQSTSILNLITISINLNLIVLKSERNNQFICMSKHKRTVHTQKYLTDNCLFQEKLEPSFFITFKSVKFSGKSNGNKDCYLAMVKNKQGSRDRRWGKVKKVCKRKNILNKNFYLFPNFL